MEVFVVGRNVPDEVRRDHVTFIFNTRIIMFTGSKNHFQYRVELRRKNVKFMVVARKI